MYSRPSASQMRAPSARSTTSGGVATPRATYRSLASWTRSVALRSCNDKVPGNLSASSEPRHDPEVVDEPGEHRLPVVRPQDGARMDRRQHEFCEVRLERPAALLRHLEALPEDALRGGR